MVKVFFPCHYPVHFVHGFTFANPWSTPLTHFYPIKSLMIGLAKHAFECMVPFFICSGGIKNGDYPEGHKATGQQSIHHNMA